MGSLRPRAGGDEQGALGGEGPRVCRLPEPVRVLRRRSPSGLGSWAHDPLCFSHVKLRTTGFPRPWQDLAQRRHARVAQGNRRPQRIEHLTSWETNPQSLERAPWGVRTTDRVGVWPVQGRSRSRGPCASPRHCGGADAAQLGSLSSPLPAALLSAFSAHPRAQADPPLSSVLATVFTSGFSSCLFQADL